MISRECSVGEGCLSEFIVSCNRCEQMSKEGEIEYEPEKELSQDM